MIVAVTSQGPEIGSQVDPRFGRAKYILIIDKESGEFEALDNSDNLNAMKGAGIQAAAMVSEKKADVLLTGHCGPNAFSTLKAAGIQVFNDVSGTVAQAIEAFEQGKYKQADSSDVEGQWL